MTEHLEGCQSFFLAYFSRSPLLNPSLFLAISIAKNCTLGTTKTTVKITISAAHGNYLYTTVTIFYVHEWNVPYTEHKTEYLPQVYANHSIMIQIATILESNLLWSSAYLLCYSTDLLRYSTDLLWYSTDLLCYSTDLLWYS